MKTIPDHIGLLSEIQKIGFSCMRCGACCREIEPGSNIVMVSPGEVRTIMAYTGLPFDEVAEPYPDTIREGDREYTFDWAIIRGHNKCKFLVNEMCSIYNARPWICRTYPFMLENGHLTISPCTGLKTGKPDSEPDKARIIFHDLLNRQKAEEEEGERIAEIFHKGSIPPGHLVVVDGEGMRTIHG